MKKFFRRISPKRAVEDLVDQWKQPTPHRWQILGVAMAATFAIFMLFVPKSQHIRPAPPEVIYISTWEEGRSEAEIIAGNCANQRLKDEMQARIEQRAELRRDMYKALGRATFIDVDSMEEEIAERREAEEAAIPDSGPSEEEIALSVEEYCSRVAG